MFVLTWLDVRMFGQNVDRCAIAASDKLRFILFTVATMKLVSYFNSGSASPTGLRDK